jgi:AcrR family transcriptional regulator
MDRKPGLSCNGRKPPVARKQSVRKGAGPIDRRVLRTRATLHEALLFLIAEKGFETTTVEDICARANVGRSTFYAHFTGKDDLMRSGLKNLRELFAAGNNPGTVSTGARGRRFAFSLAMFRHAGDHAHLHRALVGNRGGTIALDAIRQMLRQQVRDELASFGRRAGDAATRDFAVEFIVGAFMAVMSAWLDGGATLAPERVDAMFQRLALEGLAAL